MLVKSICQGGVRAGNCLGWGGAVGREFSPLASSGHVTFPRVSLGVRYRGNLAQHRVLPLRIGSVSHKIFHMPAALIHCPPWVSRLSRDNTPPKQLKQLIASTLDADSIRGDRHYHALPAPTLHAALCDLCRCTRRHDPAAGSFFQRSHLLVSLWSRRHARVAGHA